MFNVSFIQWQYECTRIIHLSRTSTIDANNDHFDIFLFHQFKMDFHWNLYNSDIQSDGATFLDAKLTQLDAILVSDGQLIQNLQIDAVSTYPIPCDGLFLKAKDYRSVTTPHSILLHYPSIKIRSPAHGSQVNKHTHTSRVTNNYRVELMLASV